MKRLGKRRARPFVGAVAKSFLSRQGSTAFPKFRRRFVSRLSRSASLSDSLPFIYTSERNPVKKRRRAKTGGASQKVALGNTKPLFSSNPTQNARALAFRSKQGRGRKSYATVKIGSSAIRATRSFRRRSGFQERPKRRAGFDRSAFSRS